MDRGQERDVGRLRERGRDAQRLRGVLDRLEPQGGDGGDDREVLLVGGAIALITLLEWWPAIFAWYADQSGLSLTIGWPLILVAGAAVGGYAVLRRATP